MVSSYDNSLPPSVYYEGFARLYQAGLTGQSRESISGGAVERLSPGQQYAAYTTGQNDAAVSLAREQRAAQFAKVAGTDSGLVFDEYVEKALNEETAEKVNKLAKSLGVRVAFVDYVRDGTANGQLSGSDIQVSMDSDSPATFVIGHEMTHRIQELAPESYREFRSIVAEDAGDQVQAMLDLYRDQGVEISYEQALDEVTANYAGELMQDEATLDRFIGEHKDDRTLLQRVRDAIKSLIRKLTGKEKDQAQRAVDKLEAALRAAQEQVKTLEGTKNAAREGGEVKFSIKYDQNNVPYVVVEEDILAGVARKDWVRTVKENLREKFPDGVTVGNNVVSINKKSRLEMTFSKYMQRLFKSEPQLYADKLRATNNAGEILTAAQNWVNEALLHPRKDAIIDFARGEVLLRIGARDYTAQVIVGNQGKTGLLLYDIINLSPTNIQEKTKKVGAEYTGNTLKESPSRGPAPTVTSVPHDVENVKPRYSLKTDSKGRQLTAGQEAYFRDSKVVDQEGNLLVMYHGTRAENGDFTVFDYSKAVKRGGKGLKALGMGNYFTSKALTGSESYGSRVIEAYLDIRKPFVCQSGQTFQEQVAQQLGEETSKLSPLELQAKMRELGYDGVIQYNKDGEVTIAVTFDSQQIKYTTNTAPTGDPDIRYSLKGSENARELAELRKENEQLRERLDYWKGQTRLTQKGQETVQLEDAKRLARRLVRDYSGTVEVDTVTEGVKGLAEYLLRGGDGMSYEGAKEKALDIAHTIAESALAKDDTYAQEYSSLRQYLKDTKLVLGKEHQSDIADYNEWRKHQFGRLNLTSQGETNIDQVYHELSQLYPEFFDEEQVSHPAVKDADMEGLLPSWACSSGTVNL